MMDVSAQSKAGPLQALCLALRRDLLRFGFGFAMTTPWRGRFSGEHVAGLKARNPWRMKKLPSPGFDHCAPRTRAYLRA